MEEVTDEPLYRDRVCGTGIGKAGMAVTVRVPSAKNPSRRMRETREFGATRRGNWPGRSILGGPRPLLRSGRGWAEHESVLGN